jgi:hypothetical protein
MSISYSYLFDTCHTLYRANDSHCFYKISRFKLTVNFNDRNLCRFPFDYGHTPDKLPKLSVLHMCFNGTLVLNLAFQHTTQLSSYYEIAYRVVTPPPQKKKRKELAPSKKSKKQQQTN